MSAEQESSGFSRGEDVKWMNGILAALLVLVSALLLVRVRSTRARMTANIGSEFAVTDLGLTLFQTGTIPWAQITNIGIIDTPHQLQQARAGLATGAGVLDVLLPRAVADDVLLVDPVLHVHAMHLVSGTNEDRSGHAAVHSA